MKTKTKQPRSKISPSLRNPMKQEKKTEPEQQKLRTTFPIKAPHFQNRHRYAAIEQLEPWGVGVCNWRLSATISQAKNKKTTKKAVLGRYQWQPFSSSSSSYCDLSTAEGRKASGLSSPEMNQPPWFLRGRCRWIRRRRHCNWLHK